MSQENKKLPQSVARLYLGVRDLHRKVNTFHLALFDGICLGLLDRRLIHAVDQQFYDRAAMYHKDAYNLGGLTSWEREAIEGYFPASGRLLVLAAGGGREVIALARMGYEVDGYDPHTGLVRHANQLLEAEGVRATMATAPRDELPPDAEGPYDGLIVGWGAYTLIQGRGQRIALLQSLRRRARPGAPVLISIYTRHPGSRRYHISAAVGSALRCSLGRDPVERGDGLAPNYVHYFTQEEIEEELRQAELEPVYYATQPYGRAVGLAPAAS